MCNGLITPSLISGIFNTSPHNHLKSYLARCLLLNKSCISGLPQSICFPLPMFHVKHFTKIHRGYRKRGYYFIYDYPLVPPPPFFYSSVRPGQPSTAGGNGVTSSTSPDSTAPNACRSVSFTLTATLTSRRCLVSSRRSLNR